MTCMPFDRKRCYEYMKMLHEPVTNYKGIRSGLLCKLNELRCQGRILCNFDRLVFVAVNIDLFSFLLSSFYLSVSYRNFEYLYSKRVVYFSIVGQPQEHRILSVINAYSHSGTQLLSFTSRPTKMGRDRVELPETEVNRFTVCPATSTEYLPEFTIIGFAFRLLLNTTS